MVNEKISTLLVGGAGAGAVEVVNTATTFNPEVITDGVGIISQIVILIATLIGLFRKKK